MPKNYYLILGVAPDASMNEIKSAYRRRVREFHPDRFGKEREPFLDIQEAYATLSDAASRRTYDRDVEQSRHGRRTWSPAEAPEPEPLVPPTASRAEPLKQASLSRSFQTYRPSYEELFDRIERNFRRSGQRKSGTVKQLVVEFTLTLEEARRGGNVQLHVPASVRCPVCGGSGVIGPYECRRCAGEGAMSGEFPIMLSYPAGIKDGFQTSLQLNSLGIRNLYLTTRFRVVSGARP